MSLTGIDLGSRTVKIAIFDGNSRFVYRIFDTAVFYREFCVKLENSVYVDFESLDIPELKMIDGKKVVSTGYGRNNVNISGARVIPEIRAHATGAVWQTGLRDFVILDIGGQDSKAALVENGKVRDMALNDKCAASCGRFVENMAAVLGITIDEISEYYDEPAELNSTCAVFGESELIGQISEGVPVARLAAGVNYALFKKVKPLLERFGCGAGTLILTGGTAKNKALYYFLKNGTVFANIIVPENPQYIGAIGCCLSA